MTIHTQKHLPLVRLEVPGVHYNGGRHVCCDYCDADATYYHWADQHGDDAVACDEHVGLLNPWYYR